MPTYEYACPKCKKNYDLRESFAAETTHPCQQCGKGVAKRVLHAPRVHFKGSGFYVTDSKSKSRGSEPATASAGESGSDSGSDSSSSSEGATPSDSKTKSETKAKPQAPATTESPAAP